MSAAISGRRYLNLVPDWLFGALCLAIPALYNSYPLLTPDSGAYITSGYLLQVPIDRPLTYSVFVRIASMGMSLWGTVAAQALAVSLLLLVIIRHFLGGAYRMRLFAGLMLLTGTATSAGWFVGQIMPDIFTAILLLICIVISSQSLTGKWKWCLYVLMLGCILIHTSNLLIALLTSVSLLLYTWRRKASLLRTTAIALLGTAATGWITLSTVNAIAGHSFRPSAASHVFMMSRMVENGIMDVFLQDQCSVDSPAYKLCAYKDHLPDRQWDFMWDTTGPLYKTGGWEANEGEYSHIIRKTLITPKYLAMHIVQNTQATFRQLPLIYIGDGLQRFGPGTSPYDAIAIYKRQELRAFRFANQQADALHLDWWNTLISLFAIAVCAGALLIRNNGDTLTTALPSLRRAIRLTLLFLIINAAVTATLATVIGRYEARVCWILPFMSMLYIVQCIYRKALPGASSPNPEV